MLEYSKRLGCSKLFGQNKFPVFNNRQRLSKIQVKNTIRHVLFTKFKSVHAFSQFTLSKQQNLPLLILIDVLPASKLKTKKVNNIALTNVLNHFIEYLWLYYLLLAGTDFSYLQTHTKPTISSEKHTPLLISSSVYQKYSARDDQYQHRHEHRHRIRLCNSF